MSGLRNSLLPSVRCHGKGSAYAFFLQLLLTLREKYSSAFSAICIFSALLISSRDCFTIHCINLFIYYAKICKIGKQYNKREKDLSIHLKRDVNTAKILPNITSSLKCSILTTCNSFRLV